MSSSRMSLLPRATLHSDSEQYSWGVIEPGVGFSESGVLYVGDVIESGVSMSGGEVYYWV